MKRILIYIVALLTAFQVLADEIVWTDITSNYSFPSGITLVKGTRNTPKLECFYFDVDLNDTNIAIRPYSAATSKNVKAFASDVNCIAAVNGGYFGGSIPYSTVIVPGQVKAVNVPALTRNSQSYPVIRSMFSLNTSYEPSIDWVYHFGQTLDDVYSYTSPLNYTFNDPSPKSAPQRAQGEKMENLLTAVGGGPILVKDSLINITYNEEIMWGSGVGLSNRDPRTAMGFTKNNHVLILCADGRQSHSEGLDLNGMAEIFREKGCTEAINLDGGGSTQMAVPGININKPSEQRPVPAILAITYRDSCLLPVEDGYSVIIDSEDNGFTDKVGSWFPSANAGYWGDTKALLSGIGDGSSVFGFSATLNSTTECDVYAWWVADPNRSSETPYVIVHENGRDTVRMDQTQGHAEWNLLGTYTFSDNPEHAVMVSNAATSGNYVVADAVKLNAEEYISLATNSNIAELNEDDFNILDIYPNPFNPSTIINYELSALDHTILEIYDMQGHKTHTLVNDIQDKGNYSVAFDASTHPSGIYFCSLRHGDMLQVEKLTLIK